MTFKSIARASTCVFAMSLSCAAHAADEATATDKTPDILVTAQRQTQTIENAPSTQATVDAARVLDTVNAASVEDTVKYLPSLVVRKRHIGDNFAPVGTRTSGLGSSARSLIYADGALLSALIANNNGNGSPRWALVSPEEVARIDVLYGPFSAAYAGNSIGTVINITTRLPDELEGSVTLLTNVEPYSLYGTNKTLPTYQFSGNIGDRFGPLAVFASATRTVSDSQPISFVTANQAAAPSAAGSVTTGAYSDLNKLGAPIAVLGAGGLEHHVEDIYKLKATLNLSDTIRLTYVGGVFMDKTEGTTETYLSNAATGAPVYSGSLNIGGYAYSVASSAFASGIYARDILHLSNSLSLTGTGHKLDWQIIGTSYEYEHDIQRTPTGTVPATFTGGAGNNVRQDGTGWRTIDGKLAWRSGGPLKNTFSIGAHWDRYKINSNRYTLADWTSVIDGALNQASVGNTETSAIWAQDEAQIASTVSLTVGGRYEWWHAYNGLNFSTLPALNVAQPEERAKGFSPKASLEWKPINKWSARLSFGKAFRFPTAGELYQAITTGPTLSVPNPNLRPEVALSEELAIERKDAKGFMRVSLFNESIDDALISQSAPLVPGSATLYSYVQNVDRTRVRGVELAVDRQAIIPHFDVQGSVTYADSQTRADTVFLAAIGKLLPSVPRWKATAVVTWRPDDKLSLTAAARYASRNYANLDNSDTVGNTYQGFYKYFVIDTHANFKVNDRFDFAVGVDNLNNDKYFLFHPFPQRSFFAQVQVKL